MTFTKSLYVAFTTITLLTLTTMLQDVKAIGSDPSIKHSSRDIRKSMNNFFNELVRRRRELSKRKDEQKEGFLDFEKDAMVLLHNSYRSVVQPTATNMIEVTWDDDIETFAQEWANKCGGDHRPNRNLNDWNNMGENLYWWTGAAYDEKRPVEWWFNERDNYNFDTQACEDKDGNAAVCGHYFTVAWAKTHKIGCGIKRCPDLGETIDKTVYYFVCNYNGRFLSDTRPYEEGPACSNCPAEFHKCRYNLCLSQAMLDSCLGYNGTVAWTGVPRPSTKSDPMKCSGFAPGNVAGDGGKTSDGDSDGDGDGDGDGKIGGGSVEEGRLDDNGDDDDDSGVSLAVASSLFAIMTTTILSTTIITSARL